MQLDGIRVLDFTRLLPGPYATQLLADNGADVVKIEDTDVGDYGRALPPHTERGVSALFDTVNRGKRSVALDLKTSAGRDVIHELVREADVLVEGFRPGVTERLGIDDDTVREHNDDIVYCSLTGYGQTGPDADRAGHDLNYVGAAGLLDMTRRSRDEAPRIPGYPIGDMAGGTFAALGILGALCSRELGNTAGEHLDVSMTDAVLSFSQSIAHGALTGESPRPGETPLTGGLPWYDVYETADGRYVTLAALEPKFWAAFCTAVDRDELIDEHGTDDPATREALRETLEEVFAARTQAEWEAELGAIDATVGPVNTPAEAVDSPQIDARGLIETPADAAPRIGFPVRSSAPNDDVPASVPAHGEHTEAVLREHGFGAAIERLRDDGVIV
ncbi:CaiB/BaiF CoA transferase family protein [Halococcus agarilyticus]|uniref:CaiB/BaiF CoA transferase family protein n=1 Tax=Halococcus agarilyticus TaxID=1232219 RepID=UPI0006776923|nr:CaiB/BaiF CoA-transferase family protein [Halococcus agarilyticus]